jgi:hypothetical protein
LGNNAMLSSSSIVVSNDQFRWYSMHKTMGNILLIQLHKNLVYGSYDICLYIPYSTYVKWWCIMWAPTLEFFIKKLYYVDYRWPFSVGSGVFDSVPKFDHSCMSLLAAFYQFLPPSSFMLDCNFEPKFAIVTWTHPH